MEREKNHERYGVFMMATLVVIVSSIAIIEATPKTSAVADSTLAVEGRGCVIYQTYPAQVSCSLAIGPSTFTMV